MTDNRPTDQPTNRQHHMLRNIWTWKLTIYSIVLHNNFVCLCYQETAYTNLVTVKQKSFESMSIWSLIVGNGDGKKWSRCRKLCVFFFWNWSQLLLNFNFSGRVNSYKSFRQPIAFIRRKGERLEKKRQPIKSVPIYMWWRAMIDCYNSISLNLYIVTKLRTLPRIFSLHLRQTNNNWTMQSFY